jgi:hypothetical protein
MTDQRITKAPVGRAEYRCEGQLAMFAGNGFTFFRELEVGDEFALGTPASHSAWFKVTGVNHRHRYVTCEYEDRHGKRQQGYDWKYNDNDACVRRGGE